jgi:hypothetical protein
VARIFNKLFGRSEQGTGLIRTTWRKPRSIKARFDAAQITNDNIKHWAAADGFSADMAASAEVRRALRQRARYEVANNSYARGIVLTVANDTIGTGPRLQMLTEDTETNREIERDFSAWATNKVQSQHGRLTSRGASFTETGSHTGRRLS